MPFLQIENRHVPGCGFPPQISNEKDTHYISYFESRSGDQWVFTFNRTTEEIILYGGDMSWEPLTAERIKRTCGWSESESTWIKSCLLAIEKLEEFVNA